MKTPLMGAELFHADRRTDTAKLIFALRNSRKYLKTSRREVTKDIFQGKLCPCIKYVFSYVNTSQTMETILSDL
jgi:hypothetical protein